MALTEQKIEGIQKKLDEKLINPKDLKPEQRSALNKAFQDGTLKGYKNVGEMEGERRLASMEVAEEIEKKLAPLTPRSTLSMGIRRGTAVAAGDIIGSFYPYIKDGKMLADEARLAAIAGQRVNYIPKIQHRAGFNAFKGFANVLSKVPILGRFKLFKGTGKLMDKMINGSRALMAGNLLTTQALRTELKSQTLGALGAGAGSVTYDLANFSGRFAASMGEDLSHLSENDLDKMSPAERMTTMAGRSMYQALLWNSLAFGGIGAIIGAGRWFRTKAGVPEDLVKARSKVPGKGDPDWQEVVDVVENGGDMSLRTAVHGKKGFSSIVAGSGKISGVMPGGSWEMGKALQMEQGKGVFGGLGVVDVFGPKLQAGLLAQGTGVQVGKVYDLNSRITQALYDKVHHQYHLTQELFEGYNAILQNKVWVPNKLSQQIPLFKADHIKKYAKTILEAQEEMLPGKAEQILKGLGVRETDRVTPSMREHANEILAKLEVWDEAGQTGFITANQLAELRKMFTKTYQQATKGVAPKAFGDADATMAFAKAYSKDMGSVGRAIQEVKNPGTNSKLGQFYRRIKAEEGINPQVPQGTADRFIKDFEKHLDQARQTHELANLSYTSMMHKYAPSVGPDGITQSLGKYKKAIGYDIATQKQLLGGFGNQLVNGNKAFEDLVNSVITRSNPDPNLADEFATYIGAQLDDNWIRLAKEAGVDTAAVQREGQELMQMILARKYGNEFTQNIIVREVTGVQKKRPLLLEDTSDLRAAHKILQENSSAYRVEYNKAAEWMQRSDTFNPKALDPNDLRVASNIMSPKFLFQYRNLLAKRMMSPITGKEIPLDLNKMRERAYLGKGLGNTPEAKAAFEAARRPPTDMPIKNAEGEIVGYEGPIKYNMTVAEAAKTPGFLTRKLNAKQLKYLDGIFNGERKLLEEALANQKVYENDVIGISKFEDFDFAGFEKGLGLNTAAGKETMKRMFKHSGIKNPEEALKLQETFINQLKRSWEAPAGSPSTWISRAILLGVGVGGPAALGPPGLLAPLFLWAGMKYSSKIMMDPAAMKYFTNLYPEMEARSIAFFGGALRKPAEAPLRRARLADFMNYIFSDDPDAPIVTPDNIDDERIREYLLRAPLSVPASSSLPKALNQTVAEAYDPDLKTMRNLPVNTYNEIMAGVEGTNIGKERDELLDRLNTPEGAQVVAQNNQLQDFVENPPTLQRGPGAQGGNLANVTPMGTQTNANMYQTMFPGDSLGAAIAQKQTQQKPTIKVPGTPTYNA